jgi:glycosyltransferase involved in cell wall biosynthesis
MSVNMNNNQNFCIFVFSFNRGTFLENCVASIIKAAPGIQTFIVDDNSTDEVTQRILEKLGKSIEVFRDVGSDVSEIKTGGLYGCMNVALEIAEERGFRYALFIQDDMQFVRKLQCSDFDRLGKYFSENSTSIQYQTCFRRRMDVDQLRTRSFIDASGTSLMIENAKEIGKDNFSATGIFDVSRVREYLGAFTSGEGANSEICRKKGIKKGLSLYPLMNWLPYPSSYRGKKRNLKHRLIEKLGGSGFHPIEFMDDKDAQTFVQRDPLSIPVAEDWLVSKTSPRQDQWSTAGGEYNLIARGGIGAELLTFLMSLRRSFRRRS